MVGQRAVNSPDEVVAGIKEAVADKRKAVLLLVAHEGQKRFVPVKVTDV
jgi:hypothetical protein